MVNILERVFSNKNSNKILSKQVVKLQRQVHVITPVNVNKGIQGVYEEDKLFKIEGKHEVGEFIAQIDRLENVEQLNRVKTMSTVNLNLADVKQFNFDKTEGLGVERPMLEYVKHVKDEAPKENGE